MWINLEETFYFEFSEEHEWIWRTIKQVSDWSRTKDEIHHLYSGPHLCLRCARRGSLTTDVQPSSRSDDHLTRRLTQSKYEPTVSTTDHLTVSKWSEVFIYFTDDPLWEDRLIKTPQRDVASSHRASPEFHGTGWNFGFGSSETWRDAALDYLSDRSPVVSSVLLLLSQHRWKHYSRFSFNRKLFPWQTDSFPLFCQNKFIQNYRIYLSSYINNVKRFFLQINFISPPPSMSFLIVITVQAKSESHLKQENTR